MGFEPTTSYLGSKHSTAELHPQLIIYIINGMSTDVKDELFWWYKRQQFSGNSGIFGNEEQLILDQRLLGLHVSISC